MTAAALLVLSLIAGATADPRAVSRLPGRAGLTLEQEAAAWWLSGRDRPLVRLCRLVELQEWLPAPWKDERVGAYARTHPAREAFTPILYRLLPPAGVTALTGARPLTRVWVRRDPPVALPLNVRGEAPLGDWTALVGDAPPQLAFRVRVTGARRRVRVLSFGGTPGRWCVDGRLAGLAKESEAGMVELDLAPGEHVLGAAWSYRALRPALHLAADPGVVETTSDTVPAIACPAAWPAEPAAPGEEGRRHAGFLWRRFAEVSEESEAQCDLSLGRLPQLADPGARLLLDPHFRARLAALRGENPGPLLPRNGDKAASWIRYESDLITADHWLEARLGEQGRRIWSGMLAAGVPGIRHRIRLIQLEAERGLVFTAFLRALALVAEHPGVPGLTRATVLLANAVPVDSTGLRAQLLGEAPWDPSEPLVLADALLARGRADEARALLERTWRASRDTAALVAWARLDPAADPAALLAPETYAALARQVAAGRATPGVAPIPTAAEIPAWLAPHLQTVRLPSAAGRVDPALPPVELLHVGQVLLLGPDGASRYGRSVWRLVRDPARAGHLAPITVSYSPHSQAVRVLRTRVHHADGQVSSQAAAVNTFDFLQGAARMYFDVRELRITFPPAAAGDVHELIYTLEDLPSTQADLGAASFGHILQLQDRWPVAAQTLRVVHPEALPLRTAFSRPAGITPIVTRRDGQVRIDVTVGPQSAWRPEPQAPGWGETLLTFQLGTTASWRDLGLAYWRYVEPLYRPRRDMRELALRLTAGAKTELEKIQAIQTWVQRNFRYVSLMFGNHGYMPYTLDEVLERKFGDCKDMTLVLVHLLREAGVAAVPAIVRTKPQGLYPLDVPSLAPFDHAIVHLPGANSWLDGTVKGHLYPVVPAWIQGRTALVVEPTGGRLVAIPTEPAGASREEEQVTVRVDEKGDALVSVRVTVTGQPEAAWRLRLLEDSPREVLLRHARRLWPQAELAAFRTDGLESLKSPLVVELTLRIPGVLPPGGARNLDFPLGDDVRLSRLVSRLQRESDFVLEHGQDVTRTLTLTWPKTWCVPRAPADLARATPHFAFTQKAQLAPGRLVLERRLSLPTDRVPRAAYPAFADAVNAALLTVQAPLTLTRCPR